jgi:hypothetical protein
VTDKTINPPQPQQVTTDTVANGIVKGYFKLVAILLCIGIGVGIIYVIGSAIGSAADSTSRSSADGSMKDTEADWHAHPHKYIEAQIDNGTRVAFFLDTACDKYSTDMCVDKKTANDAKRLERFYTNAKNAQKDNLPAEVQEKASQLVTPAEKAYDNDVLATAARKKQQQVDADAKAKKELQTDIEKGQ